jgi:hypothetical protein
MKRYSSVCVLTVLSFAMLAPARADDQSANAVLDKAIAALGGQEKLAKAAIFSWKVKGKVHAGGTERPFDSQVTANGLDQFRREFAFPQFNGLLVIDGDKAWRKTRGGAMELDQASLANEKRSAYLQTIPVTLLALKGKGFAIELAGEEVVDNKPASLLKVKPPDGKEFTLAFDKQTGLPVKEVATMIAGGGGGQEVSVETLFRDYKDFDGIKKATRMEVKRDGDASSEMEITEFKVLDKVDPDTFAKPE